MVNILKVYYKNEIRRIAVTSFVVNHYCKLCEKIIELFPGLSGKTFILGWKDGDGDDIVMSSDPELAQAVACANDEGGVMKIYVHQTEEQNNPAAMSAEPNNVPSGHNHINVICDGCGGEVNGYRYKCLQCADYDLCQACNARDVHLNHDMLKLASPYFEKRKWCFPGQRRLWGTMFSFYPDNKGACGDFKRQCRLLSKEAISPEYVANHLEKGQDFLKAVGDSVAHLLDAFGVDVEVSVKPPSDEEKKQEPSSAECNSNKAPSNSTEKDASTEMTEGAVGVSSVSSDKPDASKAVTDAENTAVKTAKDVYIEFMAKQGSDDAKTDFEKEKGARPKSPPTSKIYPDITAVQSDSSRPPFAADAMRKHAESLKEHAEKVATFIQQQAPADMLDLFKKQAEKFINTIQQTPKGSSPNDDWTILNPEPSDENTIPKAAAATPVDAEICQPDLSTGEKIEKGNSQAPPDNTTTPSAPKEQVASTDNEAIDPAIQSALQLMLSMGYNNDGGWLVRLLKSKHGNISETLDSLYQ